ncbi:hypothetical protein WA026_009677 [Henosepilachna vigintioctopunctata]|uniref:Sensory neuron membrane protein 1 n=1 Tax=Henosepilachna vigintioctopunctata TaxID=420089 RepID=A0AAW1U031_9CUCU
MQLATKILIGSSVVLVGTILISFVSFDDILAFGIRDQTSLRKRNELRSIYLKIPFPLDFKIYFFNVTNPDDVTQGAKPKLHEVGPYAYDEWVSKVDVVDNSVEDTLAYSPLAKFYFNANKTGVGLSQDDEVTILHPVIVGAISTAVESSPALLPILTKAIKSIFRDPKTIYLTDKVRNILFDGMLINCSVTDFAGKAVCSQLKSQLPGIKEVEKNILRFSLFGSRNDTLGKRTVVKRGIKNSKDLGLLVEYDGMKKLDMYDSKECNSFQGTDGWIFPVGLPIGEDLKAFSGELCRNIKIKYVQPEPYKGVPTDLYEGDLGDQRNDPDEKCYCPSPKKCMDKGLYDLTKCMGVPIIASLPHFLKCNESYLEGVEGLHPNASLHSLNLLFARELGAPTMAMKRMQLNFLIKPNPKVPIMNNVTEVLHPFLWLEEGIVLKGKLLKKIQSIFMIKKLNVVVRWFLVVACLGGIGGSVYLYYKNKDKGVITPIHMINKFIGNDNDNVENFKSEASSAVSKTSNKMEYDNRAFLADMDRLNKKF